jgi:hypothetical protein
MLVWNMHSGILTVALQQDYAMLQQTQVVESG